ncbi:MAG TPA: hypothetical protein VGP40_04600 [Chthoniobacterales bacterium]|nr:hypothetical protein [Chthoniobacterales bacterium]
MNESPRKIEIFAPFGAALDLTKLILFQPFDIAKWFVIGFAAFLSNLGGGGGGGFNFGWPGGDWNWQSKSRDFANTSSDLPGWAWPLIVIGILLLLAIVIALMWVGARGKFVFTDCVVRNRGAIVEPWKAFRRQGNSYFLFSLLAGFIVIVVLGLAGAPLWLPLLFNGDFPEGAGLVLGLSLLGFVAIVMGAVLSLVVSFMVPIMYRQLCSAAAAFRQSLALIGQHLGPVLLYLLFLLVLWMAFALIGCLVTCLTCCIAAIPYVGTVILLPVYVFFRSYLLLFVRQFGPDYDAWANVVAIEPPSPAMDPPGAEIPPLQT